MAPNSDGFALQQSISYTFQRPQRLLIDAFGGDDDEPPAHLVEFLTPKDVSEPLLRVLGVLATVVLNDQSEVLAALRGSINQPLGRGIAGCLQTTGECQSTPFDSRETSLGRQRVMRPRLRRDESAVESPRNSSYARQR
jgi:hypothetical protein